MATGQSQQKQEDLRHLSPFFMLKGTSYCRLGAQRESREEVIMEDVFIVQLTKNMGSSFL